MTEAIAQEIAQIESVMRTDRATYNRDEGMQTRLRDLYDAREGEAVPPARMTGEAERINGILQTDPQRYWRDEGMQARFRELLEAEEGANADDAPEASPRASDGGLIDLVSLKEWQGMGGSPASYAEHATLVRETNDLLAGTDDEAREQMVASFERLPSTVHDAVFAELTNRRAVAAVPLDDAGMQEVTRGRAWRELAEEWGGLASEKLGRVRARLDRIFDALPDNDARAALAWIDAAPKSTLKALGRKLAR